MAPMLFANAAYNNETIKVFNHGNQSRDFTYIDDIVEGIFRLVRMQHFLSQLKFVILEMVHPFSY